MESSINVIYLINVDKIFLLATGHLPLVNDKSILKNSEVYAATLKCSCAIDERLPLNTIQECLNLIPD